MCFCEVGLSCTISESISVWWIIAEWNVEKICRWKLHFKEWTDWNSDGSLLQTSKVSVSFVRCLSLQQLGGPVLANSGKTPFSLCTSCFKSLDMSPLRWHFWSIGRLLTGCCVTPRIIFSMNYVTQLRVCCVKHRVIAAAEKWMEMLEL